MTIQNQDRISSIVITVSDSRNEFNDISGQTMREMLHQAGHRVAAYCIVPDEKEEIQQAILDASANDDVRIILLNGGTGIAKRDVTIETVQRLMEKEMPGFGELFRLLSFQEDIGSASFLSCATAGTLGNKAIFCTPGSPKAVRLAMERLILPELSHVVAEIDKGGERV
ncbi:molybdenum cofactor biosynthesis protein B [Terribacillus halophilus]|uniref:Molybdenum cofactor biosynthesis protein B n=1 Tax=Terribacillus halophilus TaxID=361279 RepID=A0A1G6TG65_9BACI|nr:MogA/MoaB family molybdenum cofactor biosynthesis protein [Terribacillus halophilus]SDD28060.1 molybdenum cofactor biosynthesis protein B [Terribacillus halophilus]